MAVIPVPFFTLRQYYPFRPGLTPELKEFMSHTPGTPCCVQVSHSLNMANQLITETYAGGRRKNSPIKINGKTYYYLLAVDEMEKWLTLKYGATEDVRKDDAGKLRNPDQIKSYLQGRTGILVFRGPGADFHTELWDGKQTVQRDMDENAIFSQPRVLFWDCGGVAPWLDNYMSTQ